MHLEFNAPGNGAETGLGLLHWDINEAMWAEGRAIEVE